MDLVLKKNIEKDIRLRKKNLINIKITENIKQISIKQVNMNIK